MRVLITGATGLIGQEIVKQCHAQNIAVNYLTTSISKLQSKSNFKGFYWNPQNDEIDSNCFNGVDTIINLAGVPIAKRWSAYYKKEILESRLEALMLLHKTIKAKHITIKHIVSASAIGIYPNSFTHYYDENFKAFEDGFLSSVTQQWEAQVNQFKELGVKVSIVRIGIVLAKDGGALPLIAKPVKSYIGSPFGTGMQWQSWIHIEDLSALFLYIIYQNLEGVFNGVAPNAVTQKELVQDIAKVLEKPLLLPKTPSFVLKFILGEMSALVLESQRVSSKKVESLGFNFKYHHLQPTLRDLLLD